MSRRLSWLLILVGAILVTGPIYGLQLVTFDIDQAITEPTSHGRSVRIGGYTYHVPAGCWMIPHPSYNTQGYPEGMHKIVCDRALTRQYRSGYGPFAPYMADATTTEPPPTEEDPDPPLEEEWEDHAGHIDEDTDEYVEPTEPLDEDEFRLGYGWQSLLGLGLVLLGVVIRVR